MIERTSLLIIGAGPAGYTAAIYAARANLNLLQVLGLQPGGQLMVTTDVENYPGFRDTIQGPWLMEEMRIQAKHVGARQVNDFIERVDFSQRPFRCWGQAGTVYEAEAVIIATGAIARWLTIPGEETYRGFGVSACATCDGFFFKNKSVVVVGGGNTAVEETLFLTHFTTQVTLIHRRDHLRADKVNQGRLFKHPHVRVIWDTVVEEIAGTDTPTKMITKLHLHNVKTGERSFLPTEGLFVAIGHDPMSVPFKDQLELDSHGYILCKPNSTATSVPGVFAAGDVQDKIFRQAVTAAGQGCMAALEAEKFLSHHAS